MRLVAAVLVGMALALVLLGAGYWLGGNASEAEVVARYEQAMRVAGDNYVADREKRLDAAAARVAAVERLRQHAGRRIEELTRELENLPPPVCDWSDDELRALERIHEAGRRDGAGAVPGDLLVAP